VTFNKREPWPTRVVVNAAADGPRLVWFHTIAHLQGVAETEIAPANSNFAGQTIQIVDGNVDTAAACFDIQTGLRAGQSPGRRGGGLIDDDEFVIREGRLGEIIEFVKISTEIHGGVRHRPNSDRSLLSPRQRDQIERAIADITSVSMSFHPKVVLVSCSQPTSSYSRNTMRGRWSGWHSGLRTRHRVNAARIRPLLPDGGHSPVRAARRL